MGRSLRTSAPTLGEAFDPRRNSLAMTRLLLAAVVAVFHAGAIGFDHKTYLGGVTLGDLAVDGFFVLSGFLVVRSYLTLGSPARFAWHRFLRIMPAFWACLLLTAFVMAPLVALLQGSFATSVFQGENPAQGYVVNNAALMMRQFAITGIFADAPHSTAIDGSLWTLFYEALCYALVGLLGVLGVLRHRPVLVVAATALVWLATAGVEAGALVVEQERLLRFTSLFLLGGLGWLYRSRVVVSGWVALASLLTVALGIAFLEDYRALAGPAFAYLFLWGMVRVPLWQTPAADLSYGLYIWHWPIQQVLTSLGLASLGVPAFVAVSVALAVLAAFGSWYAVESPALSLRNLGRRRPEPGRHARRRAEAGV